MDGDVLVPSCNRWVRETGKKDQRGGNGQGFVDLDARRALAPALWQVVGFGVCGSIIPPGLLHPSAEGLSGRCSLR